MPDDISLAASRTDAEFSNPAPLPPRSPAPSARHRLYLSVPAKFIIAISIAICWTAFSVWLSRPWLADLADLTNWAFAIIAIGFIAYVPGFMNAFLLATLGFDKRPSRAPMQTYPALTILVAAYNEAAAIKDTLTSLSRQDYRGLMEVLILNDGSSDDTVVIANATIATLNLPWNFTFRVIDYPVNAGKAAVLNRGLALATHGLVATIDGDSWVRTDGVTQIVERYHADPKNTVAVAGAVMVRNSRVNLLTRTQEWDYFHGIAAVKRMQSMYHGTLVAQGAFSLYSRDALNEVGGWPECVGEDIVVSWALLDKGYRIGYAEDALAFTNVPTELKQFALQRKRWSRGLIEAFKAHPKLLLKKRMTTLFIWWNLFFLPLDLVYTFIFIPGLVLALFGHYWIAGPLTLAVLPLAALWNMFIFSIQRKMYHREGLKVRQNFGGFFIYTLAYSLLMQPVCVWGYCAEMIGMTKKWDTK